MFVIRTIKAEDADAYEELASLASIGIINLPKNRHILDKKIQSSLSAFSQAITQPYKENYLFVLENLATGEIGGTCGIYSKTAVTGPLHFYQLLTDHLHSKLHPLLKEMQILKPVTYLEGPSEICALFLKSKFRKEGLGKLLSLSRFLFMASHLHRFDEYTVAEMQGMIDHNQHCPFWDGLGRKFLNVDYRELMRLQLEEQDVIAETIPKWPIYSALLPRECQEVISKTHPDTLPAVNLLNKEGFQFSGEIDAFDGGPKLQAKTREINTIQRSKLFKIEEITSEPMVTEQPALLGNTRLDFRACNGNIKKVSEHQIKISSEIANALQVEKGEEIRALY